MKRRVISAYRLTIIQGEIEVPCHVIYFVVDPIETSRSIKTEHYGVIINIVGKHRGSVAARSFRKPIALTKSKLLSYFDEIRGEAEYRAFTIGIDKQEFDAEVSWFNPVEGTGYVYMPKLKWKMPIFACNISGKRSWWPEHACVSYERGQKVRVRFVDPHFIEGITPGTFNDPQFQAQDRSRMSFCVDTEGKLVNGLFGGGK